ncbi:MAG: hypothetical protein ACK559_01110 [bacterium]
MLRNRSAPRIRRRAAFSSRRARAGARAGRGVTVRGSAGNRGRRRCRGLSATPPVGRWS